MDAVVVAVFPGILVIWFLGIWLGYEARRPHMWSDGHKESSDPSAVSGELVRRWIASRKLATPRLLNTLEQFGNQPD